MEKIVLMNCSILTGGDGQYTMKTISLGEARDLVGQANHVMSAVGHESTAQIISELLDINCPVNRIKYEQQPGEVALVLQLKGRPPEGKILSREEIEGIKYEWRTISMTEDINNLKCCGNCIYFLGEQVDCEKKRGSKCVREVCEEWGFDRLNWDERSFFHKKMK